MGSNGAAFARSLLSKAETEGNIVLSPLSIYFALSLVAAGAKGRSLEEISKVAFGNKANAREILQISSSLKKELDAHRRPCF